MNIDRLQKEVERSFVLPKGTLLIRSKIPLRVAAREVFYWCLYVKGYGVNLIADKVGRHHSTICWSIYRSLERQEVKERGSYILKSLGETEEIDMEIYHTRVSHKEQHVS